MEDIVSSESDWSSDSGYGEDQDGLEFIYGGQAQGILSSLEQSIGRIDNFLSFERGFTIGDIVCSLDDPSGQMGKVVDVHMLVELEDVDGEFIKDVNSRKLQKIRSMSCGDLVVCGSWIGRVDKVVDRVTILFDDRAKYEVTTEDPKNFLSVSPSEVEDSYPYYPGQRVRVRSGCVSKSARWFCGSGKENRDEGTVIAVEAGLVHVDWFSCALFVCGLTLPPPASVIDSKMLTLLSCFPHAHWQHGDWCILPDSEITDDKNQVIYNPFQSGIVVKGSSSGGLKHKEFTSSVGKTCVIAVTKIALDILWQDGSCSRGLSSLYVDPVHIVNSHEFWPGQFVSERDTSEESYELKWGVVTTVDARERTVGVNWRTISGQHRTETMSSYELTEHPIFKYSIGDLVIRAVHGLSVQGGPCANQISIESPVKPIPVKNCGRDHSEYDEASYLSCIGSVTGFKDGCVEVTWATGLTTKVEPFEICHFGKDDISLQVARAAVDEEQNAGINKNKVSGDFKGKGKLLDHTRTDEDKSDPISNSFSIPQAALGFLSNVATRLGLKSAAYNPVSTDPVEDPCDNELLELLPSLRESILESELQASVEANILLQNLTKMDDQDNLQSSEKSVNPIKFRHFDMVVGDCSDHHFVDVSGNGSATSQVTRGWLKKVQQEWTNMGKNLPDNIFVRVFEERMDLMRAVIVGAPGTPYHDGLFFFDIYIPPEFPNVPPKVHYRSGGLRLNPNLYESGKVCLSLINTWTGSSTEIWNPESSTILQILLSLQAIVLNDNPYFNEAGFDRQIGSTEGEKNAVSYKENAFVLTCKSMLYLIRMPPQHFEGYMVEHFTSHAPLILTACKAYLEGAPVGLAFDKSSGTECSIGFKLMLSKIVPQLVEAFTKMGIDCTFFTFLNN
uniref:E2 ubiquitin-conjugating enzyme n=1 Tax=Kalanchoe fedtschenkoi TaxID=63787 RepID=A0A7N0TK43_KALFE